MLCYKFKNNPNFNYGEFALIRQSAVEWLQNEFQEMCKDFGGLNKDFIERFDQAKAKEISQKAKEYLRGFNDGKEFKKKIR